MKRWSAILLITGGLTWGLKAFYDWIVLDRLIHYGYDAAITDYIFAFVPLLIAVGTIGCLSIYRGEVAAYGRKGLGTAAAGSFLLSISFIAAAWFPGTGIGYFSLLGGPGFILVFIGFLLFGLAAVRSRGRSSIIGWASLGVSLLTIAWPLVTAIPYHIDRSMAGQLIAAKYGFPVSVLQGFALAVFGVLTAVQLRQTLKLSP